MPQGPDGKAIIIVKKVSGHGGHHGGSWKVAYADFVTSMMAFFMVLWLVNSASVKTREQIAYYFKKPGVFIKGSGTPLETGGAGILPDAFAPPADGNSQIQPHNRIYSVDQDVGIVREAFGRSDEKSAPESFPLPREPFAGKTAELEQKIPQLTGTKAEVESVAAEIQTLLQRERSEFGGSLGTVSVKLDQRGLQLEIMDTPMASMFQRGSATIDRDARSQLQKIAKLLSKLPNPIDIEGHTDAVPFSLATARRYDNWDLSVDRANTARRSLVQMGLKETQFARVVGYAAQRPKIPVDPLHPSNRRITISMRFTEQAASALKGVNVTKTESRPVRRPQSTAAESTEAEAVKTQSAEPTARKSSTDEDGTPVEDDAGAAAR